jgi:hypothetical protein
MTSPGFRSRAQPHRNADIIRFTTHMVTAFRWSIRRTRRGKLTNGAEVRSHFRHDGISAEAPFSADSVLLPAKNGSMGADDVQDQSGISDAADALIAPRR